MQNVVLIGFMGSGKSSIGRRLARSLGYSFRDTDSMISEEAGMQIPEIFKTEGEPGFRDRESRVLETLGKSSNCVIATGGGIISRPTNIDRLRHLGFVVWLKANEGIIFERVSRNQNRPLLHTPNPRQTIHDLLEAREPLYEQAAHFAIDTSLSNPSELVARLASETQRFFSCQTNS